MGPQKEKELFEAQLEALKILWVWIQTGGNKFKGADLFIKNRLKVLETIRPVAQVDENGKAVPYGYLPDSTGTLHPELETTGIRKVAVVDLLAGTTDQILAVINRLIVSNAFLEAAIPTVMDSHGNATQADHNKKRIGIAEITLAGGALANTELVPALAGYYGVIQMVSVISDTTDTYNLAFQDEDDVALTGLMGGQCNIALTADIVDKSLEGCVLYSGTNTKALEVDVTLGGGVELVNAQYLFWYET